MLDFFTNSVGPMTASADGTTFAAARMGKTGEFIVGQAHARYHEATARGLMFCAANQAVVTFGTALTATAVTFTLTNPATSTVNLSVISCGLTVVTSSTAGSIVWALTPFLASQAAVTQGTPLTVRNANGSGTAGQGLAASAATLPSAPVAIRTLAFGPVTATASTGTIRDYVDGSIVLIPGTAVTIQGITIVGTGIIDMFWEEVPRNQ